MLDMYTRKPLRVVEAGHLAPDIRVAVDQVNQVRDVLDAHGIPYWLDHMTISVNGQPARTIIHVRKGQDPQRVQAILDSAA
jgi:hypothetical protein